MKYIVTANDNWPFFGLTKLPNGEIQAGKGIDANILRELALKFEFK